MLTEFLVFCQYSINFRWRQYIIKIDLTRYCLFSLCKDFFP